MHRHDTLVRLCVDLELKCRCGVSSLDILKKLERREARKLRRRRLAWWAR